MGLLIKICGLTTTETAGATAHAGADMGGLNFFTNSPRYLADLSRAAEIAAALGPDVARVAVTVDLDNKTLEAIVAAVSPDYIQLHGSESPARVAGVKAAFGLPVIKACAISDAADVEAARLYQDTADLLLFDAKPPKPGASRPSIDRPGGWGEAFDWTLLTGTDWQVPWLLAGGLDCDNVEEAAEVSHAPGVDVSSGVETAPGVKSSELIERFVAAARGTDGSTG